MVSRYRVLVVCLLVVSGCAADYQDIGNYRVVTATDGMFGLRCQPRTDLYALAVSGSDAAMTTYLGTCGTPGFVTDQMGLPGDPSCYAVSADGTSLVYFHRPTLCGAGSRAARKPGGVYLHSASKGDILLYSARSEVGQVWSRRPIDAHSIRVTWNGSSPSRGGAVC
jgi:hypothetical protein